MDFIDYRKKLGLGFNDDDKFKDFLTRMFNFLNTILEDEYATMDYDEYYKFCMDSASSVDTSLYRDYCGHERLEHCFSIINRHKSSLEEFLLYYVCFANQVKDNTTNKWTKEDFIQLLKKCLETSHIQYQVINNDNEVFIFPKGAKELDDALISEPLEWLSDYPKARGTYVIALKQYSEGVYVRDVADNLRKALETFLQEFLNNEKNLEKNKVEICKYLGEQGVDVGVTSLFQPLINTYKNLNDRIVKHNDAIDDKLLEFLLYQTGVLIRMIISV